MDGLHSLEPEEPYDGDMLGMDRGNITNPKSKRVVVKVEGTMDSGASDSVAPIGAAPGVPALGSAGSRRGQHYVSAANERIPNIGEPIIKFTAAEGKKSIIKWQNTLVTKLILSVSHICDSGHK
eukprot:10223349-Heterocapsa_arctica.AAC.1